MNIRKLTALLLMPVILLGISACKKQPANSDVTELQPAETGSYYETPTAAPPEEQTTLLPLEFDKAQARLLGTFESEIYGTLTVYFQQDRFFLFDPFGTQRFEVYAYSYIPEYEDTPIELTGEDVNFDGYTDFYLLYSEGNLNSYYCFWLWNMENRRYEYYLPLSSIPSPVVDGDTKRITASDQISFDTVITTEYVWNNGEIVPISNSEKKFNIIDASEADMPDETDSSVAIIDGMLLSTVIMNEDTSSSCHWLCRIEDDSIVRLSSNTLDRISGSRTFLFRGLQAGTTTVVMRYAESWDDNYVTQRILNITVNRNYTLKIVVVE